MSNDFIIKIKVCNSFNLLSFLILCIYFLVKFEWSFKLLICKLKHSPLKLMKNSLLLPGALTDIFIFMKKITHLCRNNIYCDWRFEILVYHHIMLIMLDK